MIKGGQLKQERAVSIVLFVMIGVALILKLINVFNAPAHWDTGLYLNIAVGYFERGILTPLMWRFNPEWNIVTGSGSGYGVYLLIGWVRLFGLSILSGHVLMYVVGLVNLPVIYVVAKRFYGKAQAGLWALAFFALSGTFAQTFYIRMDAPNILAGSLILLLHVEAVKRDKWWLHMAVGVALVAALEVHVLAAFYAGAIGLSHAVKYLQLMRDRGRFVMWSPAIACGIALTLAAIAYFAHHIAPNPDLYLLIPRHCDICTPLTPLKELERWYLWFSQQPLLSIFMVGIGVLSALQRRTAEDRDYLLLLGGAYLALLVLNPPKYEWYTGHLLPLLALGVGGLYSQGLDRRRPQFPALRLMGLALAFTAILVLVRGTSFTYARATIPPLLIYYAKPVQITPGEYVAAIDYIRRNIPKEATIVGRETFYIDLLEYRYFISQYGIDKQGLDFRGETYFDLWQREKPQVFIGDARVDPDIQRYITEHGGFVEVLPKLWVDKALLKVAQLKASSEVSDAPR